MCFLSGFTLYQKCHFLDKPCQYSFLQHLGLLLHGVLAEDRKQHDRKYISLLEKKYKTKNRWCNCTFTHETLQFCFFYFPLCKSYHKSFFLCGSEPITILGSLFKMAIRVPQVWPVYCLHGGLSSMPNTVIHLSRRHPAPTLLFS